MAMVQLPHGIKPGRRGTVLMVKSSLTVVRWDPGSVRLSCDDSEIRHLDVLDTLSEIQ
ncbi:MAG: hypothetical protein AB7L09_02425 [Nitrospira sp.]